MVIIKKNFSLVKRWRHYMVKRILYPQK